MSSGCRCNARHRWDDRSVMDGHSWAVDCDALTVKLPLDAHLDRSARPLGRRCECLACTPIEITLKGE